MKIPNLPQVVETRDAVALFLARERAGNSKAARMAMMAMTTSSSISVNADLAGEEPEAAFGFDIERGFLMDGQSLLSSAFLSGMISTA